MTPEGTDRMEGGARNSKKNNNIKTLQDFVIILDYIVYTTQHTFK